MPVPRLLLAFAVAGSLAVATATFVPGASSRTFSASADAYVRSSKPAVNFGGRRVVRAGGLHAVRGYARFRVHTREPIAHARLHLFVVRGSAHRIRAQRVSSRWRETAITWSRQPRVVGSKVAQGGPARQGRWVDIDVSSIVRRSGTYSFRFSAIGAHEIALSSRNARHARRSSRTKIHNSKPPRLEITTAPVNTQPPEVSGTTAAGSTLSASSGNWRGSTPMSLAYEWRRCNGGVCSSVAGANGTGYILTSADLGATLEVSVTASNRAGSATATSTETAVVTAPPGGPPPSNYPASFFTGPAGANNLLPVFGNAWLGLTPGGEGVPLNAALQQQLDREAAVGRKIPLAQLPANGCGFPTADVNSIVADGWLPIIFWAFNDVSPDTVVNGSQDACIDQWASGAAADGKRLFIRMWWEFNGDWMPWSFNSNGSRVTPAQHVAAWRYVVDRFRARGATNLSWVWSPNEGNYNPANGDGFDETQSYPGDAYVDWVGADGYNWNDPNAWCGAMGSPHTGWCQFEEIFHDVLTPGGNVETDFRGRKPVMIAETGSNNGTAGQKAQWLVNARDRIKAAFPGVLAFIYFDIDSRVPDGCCNWRLDSQPDVIANGFKPLADDPYFQAPLP
jgi:hypothetical protein